MKISCPECGHSAIIDPVRIPVGGVMARCPKCPCRFRVQADTPEVLSDFAECLLVVCPACTHEQPFSSGCIKCGVIFARFRPRPKVRINPPVENSRKPSKILPRVLWPAVTLVSLLFLWLTVKDLLPTNVVPLHETLAVAAGLNHTVALRKDGTIWTWGDNRYGQLGNGSRDAGYGHPVKVAGLDGVVSVAAGERHSLALKEDGTVWSWGDNEHCQLGDATGVVGHTEPIMVNGLEGITAIAAGDYFSVALKDDGTLWYFGDSFFGGGTNGGIWHDFARPHQVEGVSDVVSFACGRRTIVALKEDGTVWCWGDNSQGQLGNGSYDSHNEPIAVPDLYDVTAVAAGEKFTMALKSDGTVWGWGTLYIAGGENLQRRNRPEKLAGLSGVANIKAGYWLGLALKRDGTVWYSGADTRKQEDEKSGWQFLKRSPVASTHVIYAGGKDAFLEKQDGTLLCWGLNDFGQPEVKGKRKPITLVPLLFSATAQAERVPAAAVRGETPAPLTKFQGIAAGSEHSVALARNGTVWTWGENNSGQLGSKKGSANSPLPVYEKGEGLLSSVVQVTAGSLNTLAVKADGTVWIWGLKMWERPYLNVSRQDANGIWGESPLDTIPPTRIAGVEDAIAVAGGQGGLAFVLLHRDGTLSTFGGANDQFLPHLQVRPFPELTDIVAISAGAREFAALKRDGTVWTWGSNDRKSLPENSKNQGAHLHLVENLNNVVKVVAGTESILVVKSDGTVWGWGSNLYAQTPGGLQVTSSLVPVQIPDLAEIVDITTPASGYTNGAHFLALDRKGRVWSWGYNFRGQLGQGTKGVDNVMKPALVEGLDEVTALATGKMHALALRKDGSIWSWGGNSSGQLGNASGSDSAFPVRVILPTVKEGSPR